MIQSSVEIVKRYYLTQILKPSNYSKLYGTVVFLQSLLITAFFLNDFFPNDFFVFVLANVGAISSIRGESI